MICFNYFQPGQGYMIGWLCFTSHRQRGHLETAPQFTVPCEGHEARFFSPFPPGIDPRAVAWQSITLLLRHLLMVGVITYNNICTNYHQMCICIYIYSFSIKRFDINKMKVISDIFPCQASLTRQAFLITPIHGSSSKTGKKIKPKK